MKNTLSLTLRIVALAFAIAAGMLLSAISAFASGSDAFNRPHLGPRWVVTSGTLTITNHELTGSSLSIGYLKASSGDTAASAVVFLGGTDLEYGAVAVGNIAAGTNAFVKIQEQNGDGMFEYAAFYTGNNGSGNFFQLSSPVPSPAILDVFFCGTTATMRITSSAGVQTYTYNYGTTFGAGGGLGTFGLVGLDNYVGFPTSCNDAGTDAIPATQMPSAKDLSLVK